MGSRVRSLILPASLYGMASFLIAGILAGGVVGYFVLQKTAMQNMFAHYNTTLNVLSENLNSYLHTEMNRAQELAQSSEVIQASQDPNKAAQLASFFQKKLPATSHQLLFSAEHHVLFTSTGDGGLYETNSALKASAQRSRVLVSPDISDFVIIPGHRPTLYITVPVLGKNRIVATLAVSIDYEYLTKLVSDYSQLGATGEFIIAQIVNAKITTIFPTRFAPTIAFNEYPDPTIQEILHVALNGEAGSRIAHGLVYVWQYMPLVQWGIAVKSNYAQGMKALRNIRIFILVFGVICLLGIIFCWYRAWLCLRNFYSASLILSVFLQIVLYGLFIGAIWLSVLAARTHYKAYHQRANKELLTFKGGLQKAALMINYRASLVEDAASSFVADSVGHISTLEDTTTRLQRMLHDNPEVQSAVYVFEQGKSWDVLAYTAQVPHEVKRIELSSEQKQFWKGKMLERHVAWILEKSLIRSTPEPMYVLPFYSPQDIERRTPVGCLCLMYSMSDMLETARHITGDTPIALLQQDGLVVYKDQNFPQVSTSYSELSNMPVQVNGGAVYTEEMISLGWYLQALFVPASQIVPVAYAVLIVLVLLGCMFLCAYGLYCALGLTNMRKRSNLFLASIAAIVVGCLTLVLLTLL